MNDMPLTSIYRLLYVYIILKLSGSLFCLELVSLDYFIQTKDVFKFTKIFKFTA